jgi:hypothetical protein
VLIIICDSVWGVLWLVIAIGFFAAGVIVGLVAFKVRFAFFIIILYSVIDDGQSEYLNRILQASKRKPVVIFCLHRVLLVCQAPYQI